MAKREPIAAAQAFIAKHYPDCKAAILAGSVVRGEATETSDLDMVIFDPEIPFSYRESVLDEGWPIELFVHNMTSYRHFFEMDKEDAIPTMPRMVAEGIVLKGKDAVEPIRREARELMDAGPDEWLEETIIAKRYFITDVLDDFIGCPDRGEGLFIANKLADLAVEFVLRTNRKWLGNSKWVARSLKQFDEGFASRFIDSLDAFYRKEAKEPLIQIVDEILEPYGGRLFEGFSLGKIEI
ncbi:nucleotidyltransferase domain-containing protein [Neobacillus notoginsengisoli]|uniref:Nucleotidyltransferase domain-containing protein n=1 Tax=Neobacillus notoginsengisoli TaxID=1578198 RepID=A0A417Z001_9BACI|nr:nucleotidyltransferase domain-containing protein [Neobacillus notoginsengisoli]RHW43261.1 nucleotidyltransferase domain-containing protein [Neobacillus notoginsengisoli]